MPSEGSSIMIAWGLGWVVGVRGLRPRELA